MSDLRDWANRSLGEEPAPLTEPPRVRVDKQATLYLHVLPDEDGQTQYECRDCMMFVADSHQCTIHRPEQTIKPFGSCGFWVPGPATTSDMSEVHGTFTIDQTGYGENAAEVGFSCKRCVHFRPDPRGLLEPNGGCEVVDFNSPGDDPGAINPNGCCNAWEPDPERSTLPR